MTRAIPLLLKPTVLTFRNRLRRRDQRRPELIRNGVLVVLTAFVLAGAYFGGLWVLEQTKTQIDFAYFHSSMLLGLVLFFLMLLLTLTNTIGAVSSLYLSRDLGLLLSSPISVTRFFGGKFVELIVSSSWMTAVFITPVIAMFGTFYGGGSRYYLLSLAALVPYFIIPASLSIIISAAMAVFVPLHRKRELFILMLVLGLAGLIALGRAVSLGFEDNARIDLVDILQLISLLSVANRSWVPSYWVAGVLGEELEPTGAPAGSYLLLLYSAAAALCALAYLCVRLVHFEGFSRQGLGSQGRGIDSAASQRRAERLLGFLKPPARALVVKEWKTASRDFTQSVNVVVLLGFFALYLYMLTFENLFRQMFAGDHQRWWRMFLLITNICLESFVITAMGTRLVFPSVSRESHAWWVLQTAPLSIRRLLKIKFLFWLTLVAGVTSVFFGIAAYLTYGSLAVVFSKIVLNIFLCFALVGLGTGLGAYFANFNWEHPSQLTTGFGSLVYMLVGVTLIGVTLILTACSVWFGIILPRFGVFTPVTALLAAFCGLAVPAITLCGGAAALALGARALEARS